LVPPQRAGHSPLRVEGNAIFVQPKGENSNPFYQVPQIKKALISAKAKLETVKLRNTFLYDIKTKPGVGYTFVSE
jgi:alpha-L-fucosidase 2